MTSDNTRREREDVFGGPDRSPHEDEFDGDLSEHEDELGGDLSEHEDEFGGDLSEHEDELGGDLSKRSDILSEEPPLPEDEPGDPDQA